jgi:hypothetical protein
MKEFGIEKFNFLGLVDERYFWWEKLNFGGGRGLW